MDESDLAAKRQRNRENQQKCRERKRKAREAALKAQLDELRLALATATGNVLAKRRHAAALRRRVATATDALSPLVRAHMPARRARAAEAFPGGAGVRHGRQAVVHREPCAIFVDATARRISHVEVISRSRMHCDGLGMEARIDAFRAAAAQRLGCDQREILWLFESDSVPALTLTQSGGFRTRADTPESIARSSTLWFASQLQMSLHRAIATRLEAHLPQLQQPRGAVDAANLAAFAPPPRDWTHAQPSPRTNLPPSVLDDAPELCPRPIDEWDSEGDALPGALTLASAPASSGQSSKAASRVPSTSQFAADDGDLDPTAQDDSTGSLADQMLGVYLSDGSGADAFLAPSPVPCASDAECRTVADALALARHVFGGVLQAILPHAHPKDVIRTARRFRARYRMKGSCAPGEQLTMATAYSAVVEAAHQVLQAACAHVCEHPVVPSVPASAAELEERVSEHHQHAANARLDFIAYWYVCSLDRPEYTVRMDLQLACKGSPKELLNELRCYRNLALNTQQKLQLAAILATYRERTAQLDRERDAALSALELLPSAADAPLEDPGVVACAAAQTAVPPGADAPGFTTIAHARCLAAQIHELAPGGAASEAAASAPPGFASRSLTPFAPTHTVCNLVVPCAAAAAGQPPPAQPPRRRLDWPHRLLGVSAEETAAAAGALAALQAVLRKRQHLWMRMRGSIRDVLTWKQYAILWEDFRLEVDRFALCEMATAELRCDRMFSLYRAVIGDASSGALGGGG